MAKEDNFVRYVLTNIDTSLAATDEAIMNMYAGLVEEAQVRQDILGMLLDELALTRKMMLDLLTSPIATQGNHHLSTQLRADALLPLHTEQVDLLRAWREARKNGDKPWPRIASQPAAFGECHCQCHGYYRVRSIS